MIEIVEFKDNDLDALIQIHNYTTKELNWNEFNEQQREIVLFNPQDTEDREEFYGFCKENLTLVAKEGNEVVGFICMTKKKTKELKAGFILFFFVNPKKVGKGIGKLLHYEAEKRAIELGIKSLSCHSSAYAIPVYKKLGFKDMGLDPWQVERDNGDIVVFNDHLLVKKI